MGRRDRAAPRRRGRGAGPAALAAHGVRALDPGCGRDDGGGRPTAQPRHRLSQHALGAAAARACDPRHLRRLRRLPLVARAARHPRHHHGAPPRPLLRAGPGAEAGRPGGPEPVHARRRRRRAGRHQAVPLGRPAETRALAGVSAHRRAARHLDLRRPGHRGAAARRRHARHRQQRGHRRPEHQPRQRSPRGGRHRRALPAERGPGRAARARCAWRAAAGLRSGPQPPAPGARRPGPDPASRWHGEGREAADGAAALPRSRGRSRRRPDPAHLAAGSRPRPLALPRGAVGGHHRHAPG